MDARTAPVATKRTSKSTSKTTSKRGKGLPRSAQDLSKEELLLTLQKKKECNAKALKIVEGLLEPIVREEWFLDMLQHINDSHLQDITEERAISKLCGYPLCTNGLKNVPSQQFRISTKLNKVYDITERKNFCSNKCFTAYKFIKDQMYTSPLWLRDIEPVVKFQLMPSTGVSGGAGDEVNVQVERVSREEVKQLSQEERSLSKLQSHETPSLSEKLIVDALDSLHLVTSMQGSSTTNFSESLGSFESKKSNTLDEGSTLKHIENAVKSIAEETSRNKRNIHTEESKTESCNQECSDVHFDCMSVSNEEIHQSVKDEPNAKMMSEKNIPLEVKMTTEIESTSPLTQNSMVPSSTELEKLNDKTKISDDGVSSEVFTGQIVERKIMKEETPLNHRAKPELVTPYLAEICLATKSEPKDYVEKETEHPINISKGIQEKKTNDDAAQSSKGTGSLFQKRHKKYHYQKNARSGSLPLNSFPLVSHVEKCVQEWFTMETMCFLFGESALREMLEAKGESIQAHYKALSTLTWDQEKHERFLTICKRLKLLEIEDNSFDSQVMKNEADSKRKPLPDYSALQREAESMELKVKAFYRGKLELEERKVSFAEGVKDNSEEGEPRSESQIPLVHLHSQRALRKRIVLDGLNRVLPDFLRTFGIRPSEMTSSIRGLIGTFALSSTNITFKPQEWSLIGLIVIKLLSVRELELKQCLQREQCNTYLTLMLMSYKQEPGYLDRLLLWLTDIDKLLARLETKDEM